MSLEILPDIGVARTVDLDHEPQFGAVEVGDVVQDRMLPSELESLESTIAQPSPDDLLFFRAPFAKVARAWREFHRE